MQSPMIREMAADACLILLQHCPDLNGSIKSCCVKYFEEELFFCGYTLN